MMWESIIYNLLYKIYINIINKINIATSLVNMFWSKPCYTISVKGMPSKVIELFPVSHATPWLTELLSQYMPGATCDNHTTFLQTYPRARWFLDTCQKTKLVPRWHWRKSVLATGMYECSLAVMGKLLSIIYCICEPKNGWCTCCQWNKRATPGFALCIPARPGQTGARNTWIKTKYI